MHGRTKGIAAGIGLACALLTGSAFATSPFLESPPPEEAMATPAYRYANMTNEQAFAELDRRGISYERVGPHGTVRAPIRLTGKLHDVDIHGALPAEQRKDSMFEILDARLALALDDFSVILKQHDVVEVVHYTMYRPNVPSPEERAAAEKAASEKVAAEKTAGSKATGKKPANDKVATKKVDAEPHGAGKAPATETKKSKRNAKRRAQAGGARLDEKATKGSKATRRSGGGRSGSKLDGPSLDVDLDDEVDDAFDIDDELSTDFAPEGAKTTPKKKASAPAPRTAGPGTKKARGDAKVAKKSLPEPQRKWAPPGTRHPAGLAIDVGAMKKSDGTSLVIATDFGGKLGDRTCGAGVSLDGKPSDARELRAILCQAKDSGIFTYALTPNFDADHADHFHLEIKPGVTWFLYH
ncbi:MAG: hypothetical protein HOW73_14920 [Polyangiaceae bacterium]|nr:hypothetical protein [Polyangiaceae bacterium]